MLKPPGCAGSLARKSSSGSVSGVSASVCASPAAGKGKAGPERCPFLPDLSQNHLAEGSGRLAVVWGRGDCWGPCPQGASPPPRGVPLMGSPSSG